MGRKFDKGGGGVRKTQKKCVTLFMNVSLALDQQRLVETTECCLFESSKSIETGRWFDVRSFIVWNFFMRFVPLAISIVDGMHLIA